MDGAGWSGRSAMSRCPQRLGMQDQFKSSRPIEDKLARQIERHQGKVPGWLNEPRETTSSTAAEKGVMELALSAWRSTNSSGRKALRAHLELLIRTSA